MMISFKQYSISLCLLVTNFAALQADIIPDYSSGKTHITRIMADDEVGVNAYNKAHIHPAEVLNLSEDLNIPEIAKFFECKTAMGHAFLEETLKAPLSVQDKDTIIARRQNIIKALVQNPTLKKEIEQMICAAQRYEQDIIIFMSDGFKKQRAPEIAQLEVEKKEIPWIYPVSKFFRTNVVGKSIDTASDVTLLGLSGGTAACTIYAPEVFVEYARELGLSIKRNEMIGTGVYNGLVAIFIAYKFYKEHANAVAKRSKMHAFNQLIDVTENIEELCKQYALANQFTFSAIKDAHSVALIDGLKHARYKDESAYFFMTPLVHTFAYQVYEDDTYLAPLFACIAEMDAYNAIATKMIESQSTETKFCFGTYLESETPAIHAEGFWNVLVKNAVPNTLREDKNIILTGPNAGGKTTAIRALIQNIVFMQTFGIAAATQWQAPLFDVIHSYLNISDDLLNGDSLFKSEVKRAQAILEKIKSLESTDKKFFFALDELFTGTGAQFGEQCAYEFIKRIAEYSYIQFIYATHFDKLKELGNEKVDCINYQVDAPAKDAEGKLVYPFTVSQGASTVNVAMDIAKEAGLFA